MDFQRDQLILDHILTHILMLHEKHLARLAIATHNVTCIKEAIGMDPEDIRTMRTWKKLKHRVLPSDGSCKK